MTLNDIFDGLKNLIHLFFNWLMNVDLTPAIIIASTVYVAYKATQKLNIAMTEMVGKKNPNKDISQSITYITDFIFYVILLVLAYFFFR